MTDWNFVNLVEAMRQAQMATDPQPTLPRPLLDALKKRWDLEAQVDAAIAARRQGTPPALFDEE